MKPFLLIRSLCLLSTASLLIAPAVQAKEAAQPLPFTATTKLRDLKQPAKTVKEWLVQVEAATVTVTSDRPNYLRLTKPLDPPEW